MYKPATSLARWPIIAILFVGAPLLTLITSAALSGSASLKSCPLISSTLIISHESAISPCNTVFQLQQIQREYVYWYTFYQPLLEISWASVAVETGLRISLLLSQRLTVKLFNLICWEWSWSSFSFISCLQICFSPFIFIDHLTSMLYKGFSAWLGESEPKCVSAWSGRSKKKKQKIKEMHSCPGCSRDNIYQDAVWVT